MAATTRSMPASPALGANTVRPDGKALKAEALKVALIHLLAVRPVSERFICTTLKCSTADVALVLEKYGRPSRLDPSKFDLSDRGYKELDVWKFNYKNQEDRQAAIDRAVKAYDRQRISREEKLWQLLLSKEERGKGKILSNLSLHNGPITKVSTPRINVQSTDETKAAGDATATDSDDRNSRLAPGNAETMARSRSQDPIEKKRVSEKEAQTRRLLSKNPKKAQASKPKETKPKEAKPSKPVGKEVKKTPAPDASKVKSTEFVHDSDEDVEMEDAVTLEAPAPAPKRTIPIKTAPVAKPAGKRLPPVQKEVALKVKEAEAKKVPSKALSPQTTPNLSKSSSSASTHRLSDASQSSTSMMRTLSHKRTISSPMKPSPLGSSPPANASDFDNDKGAVNSSSSTTPMINFRKANSAIGTVNPTQAPAVVNSDRGLKRKANDIDSDIHTHGGVAVTDGKLHPAKRQQTLANTPPTSDSSNETSPRVSIGVLHQAQRFKKLYHEYSQRHRQLSAMEDPPHVEVDRLIRMHSRLEELKAEISQAVGA